ncbi:hypothetical protein DRO66_09260 [Candidatus Bathyarchaeota archaeon]|nr:MAG: hypothetical protein DRO66_09260 [Candidatus Bathyarchaeota archaeon]
MVSANNPAATSTYTFEETNGRTETTTYDASITVDGKTIVVFNEPTLEFEVSLEPFVYENNNHILNLEPVEPFRRSEPRIGRNESCPCDSGKKYKQCCLK